MASQYSAKDIVRSSTFSETLEKSVKAQKKQQRMLIGVPKETMFQENRVALTPETVAILVNHGHQVMIESGAGQKAHYSDRDYSNAGAIVSINVADIFTQSDFIVKVGPLSEEEIPLLKDRQTIISALNLGQLSPDYLYHFLKKNITGIAFEFFQAPDGSLPVMQMMSEIAGVASIHIASELLADKQHGKGILLGGVTGIPPALVTIIGAGTVGYHAAKTALGMGARVRIIDEAIHQLIAIKKELGLEIYTAVSQYNYIRDSVIESDVVIGAAFKKGKRAPIVVSEEMVQQMKKGSVIIDVAIDQGGCIETSEVTNHDHPYFIKDDIIHFCVPNIASKFPRTATIAISNVLGPLLISIGEHSGLENLMRADEGVKQGVYCYRKHITKKSIANMFGMGMNFRDISLLMATML